MSQKISEGLSSAAIKLIAIIAMTADHIAWRIAPGFDTRAWVLALHCIGRMTAPIMWFFIAEGYAKTRSLPRYALRLLILAVISHFAWCFCFSRPFFGGKTSVIWSLLMGLLCLWVYERESLRPWQRACLIALLLIAALPADWSCVGASAILVIGANRGDFRRQALGLMLCTGAYALYFSLTSNAVYGVLQLFTCLALVPLTYYNGERGGTRLTGRLFYAYYPIHLLLIGLL